VEKDKTELKPSAAEVLEGLICHIDKASGDVVCPICEEELAEIQKLPNQPRRVVFEVKPKVERKVEPEPEKSK